MLVDVKFKAPPSHLGMVLSVIAGDGPLIPDRIGEGMYVCGHWSIDQLGVPTRNRWQEERPTFLDFDEYGVCDFPEQVVERFNLKDRPERFFISFVKLRRAEQPKEGGWRWHKWGSYIGDREPQCEYLHDEPEIEEVYTYHVYELQAAA